MSLHLGENVSEKASFHAAEGLSAEVFRGVKKLLLPFIAYGKTIIIVCHKPTCYGKNVWGSGRIVRSAIKKAVEEFKKDHPDCGEITVSDVRKVLK